MGLLLHTADTHEFMQVIEPMRNKVERLYKIIARDLHHKHAFVLCEKLATSHMSSNWRMGFVAAAPQDLHTTTGSFR